MSGGYEKLTGWLRNLFGVDVSASSGSVSHAKKLTFGVGTTYAFNEATETATVSVETRIEDGLRVRLYLDGSPSVNQVIPGITGATSGGLSLTRTGTGAFQFTCPSVTIDGHVYEPNRPIACVESGVAVVTSRIGSASQIIEVRTYNASHALADVSGLGVLVWVPYQRVS